MVHSQHEKERLGKFDRRSDEGILVGHSIHSKAYCVYNKRTRSIEKSVHIDFDESNDGNISSSSFQEFKLSRYDDDEEEEKVRANANKEHQEILLDPLPDNNMPPSNDEPHTTNEKELLSNAPNEEITHEQRRC